MIKKIFQQLLLVLMSIASSIYSIDYIANNEIIDDDRAAELITVITTTNPIPSIPDLKHIYPAQASLFQIPAFKKCKKIIVFDGICPGYEGRATDYKKYKQNIKDLIQNDPFFSNTELIFCDAHVHLCGTIREALKRINTPFLFIHQHDDILLKEFDLNGCLASMIINPNIKHIHLTRYPNKGVQDFWYGPVDDYVEGGSFVPLSRCFGWSDYSHVTTVDYYKNFVFPLCKFGCMEWWLHPALQEAIKGKTSEEIDQIHLKFGTYLYGNLTDGNYIHHSDGRKN